MRRIIVLLLVVSLVPVGFMLRSYLQSDADDVLGPHIPERAVLDSIVVWSGNVGELEFVLCPVFPDAKRSQFDQKKINEYLNADRNYLRLLAVNHSDQSVSHPLSNSASWKGALSGDVVRPIDALLSARDGLPAWLRHGLNSETSQMNQTIGASSLSSVLMEVSSDVNLNAEDSWMPVSKDLPELVRGRLGVEELLTFLDRPSGRLSDHVLRVQADEPSGSR